MRYLILISCALINLGSSLLANPAKPGGEINPALHYYRAFLLAPNLNEADMDYLASNNLWSATLPKHFGELVQRYDAQFKVLRGTIKSSEPCDWGLNLSDGPSMLLPHLAPCKAVMIGARYRVAWALQQNRQSDARDDLLAAFTLARNISHDGTLISVLVQIASECIGCDAIAENYGKFSAKTLQELVQGLDAAPVRGTVAAGIASEKINFHDWLLGQIEELQKANPSDEAKVMAGIQKLFTSFDDAESEPDKTQSMLWDKVTKAGGNSSNGILKLIEEEGAAYSRWVELLSLPYGDFDSQATTFTEQISASANPLISQVIPACIKARQREFKIQVWSAMIRTALEYKLHGEPGLLNVTDPCGRGPFAFNRFFFDGIDRGFELKSSFGGSGFPEKMIFVEKPGPPFLLDGPHAGEARVLPGIQK